MEGCEVVQLYYEKDGDLSKLKEKTIAVCGYGNQGRSQALNMRDAGLTVIIGNRLDEYRTRAENDGFQVYNISEASRLADVIFILLPDELQESIYRKEIEKHLKEKTVLVFAHGYNIAFGLIIPSKNIDVLLIAPRMIGIGVRECILNGEGYFSFIGVHQNASGKAKEILLALSRAVGGLSKAGIEVTFEQETILDLFTEQGFGPASSQIMMKPIELLIEEGYPEEAVLIEFILSGNMKYTFSQMLKHGIIEQIGLLDKQSQYGLLTRGLRYKEIISEILEVQKDILNHIESGAFSIEWEKRLTKLKFKFLKFMAPKISFGPLEKRVRKNLGFPDVDLWAETPYPTMEDISTKQELTRELEEFKLYSEF